ncbi:MAG: hypothetical protein KAT65_10330, partial [Methanophagales archaeon]|nr:hypothetical protein [Methanophagales archaeon]
NYFNCQEERFDPQTPPDAPQTHMFGASQVITKLKTVKNLLKAHDAQLINYLKATGIKAKVGIKRMVVNLPAGHDSD